MTIQPHVTFKHIPFSFFSFHLFLIFHVYLYFCFFFSLYITDTYIHFYLLIYTFSMIFFSSRKSSLSIPLIVPLFQYLNNVLNFDNSNGITIRLWSKYFFLSLSVWRSLFAKDFSLEKPYYSVRLYFRWQSSKTFFFFSLKLFYIT